jgi:hypothetical protein
VSNGQVVNTSDIREGMELVVMATKQTNLVLGAGMRDRDLFVRIEEAINRPINQYIFGIN